MQASLPQVTALGKPALLERVSNALLALRGLFKEFDSDDNNVVTREEFTQARRPDLCTKDLAFPAELTSCTKVKPL